MNALNFSENVVAIFVMECKYRRQAQGIRRNSKFKFPIIYFFFILFNICSTTLSLTLVMLFYLFHTLVKNFKKVFDCFSSEH